MKSTANAGNSSGLKTVAAVSPALALAVIMLFMTLISTGAQPKYSQSGAGSVGSNAPTADPACPPVSTGADGAFAPQVNTVLNSGVYNFTTINIPAGVQVTTYGNGILDLRASGNVTIAGTINLSGGAGGSGTDALGCSGGATGFPQSGSCSGSSSGGSGGIGGTGFTGQNGGGASSGRGGQFGGGGGGNGGGGGGGYAGGGGAAGPGSALGGNGAGTGGLGGNCSGCGGGGGVSGGAPYNGAPGANSSSGAGGGGGAIGSDAANDLAMSSTFRPGSGGGGGGGDTQFVTTYHGAGGGGGGGAMRITGAAQMTINGTLFANGGGGGYGDGGGGGGSGGAIFLAAPSITFGNGALTQAIGGVGGTGGGTGGGGGKGRILLSANVLNTGSAGFNPPLPPAGNAPGYAYVAVYCLNTPTPAVTATSTATNTPAATSTPALATIVGHVTWQGMPTQPSVGQQLPVTLTIKSGATELNYPLMLTDPSGFFTVTATLPGGVYNWRARGPMFLSSAGTLTLTGVPVTQVEMGLMRVGDLNGDDVVNGADFNLLKNNFGIGGAPPLRPTSP